MNGYLLDLHLLSKVADLSALGTGALLLFSSALVDIVACFTIHFLHTLSGQYLSVWPALSQRLHWLAFQQLSYGVGIWIAVELEFDRRL